MNDFFLLPIGVKDLKWIFVAKQVNKYIFLFLILLKKSSPKVQNLASGNPDIPACWVKSGKGVDYPCGSF